MKPSILETYRILEFENKQKRTSLIVGAGAVENAWAPIIRALQKYYDYNLDADSANCILARLVYLLRWYSSTKNQKELKICLDFSRILKREIAEEIIKAQSSGELRVRTEFKEIVEKYLFSKEHQSVLFSTNWDTVIDKAINKIGQSNYPIWGSDIITAHVHGVVNSHELLYLPTEVNRELYRTKKEDIEMLKSHSIVWRTLEKCNISIVYGLSLSPLDAELCQILASGWDSEKLETVIIINPEHNLISNRVKSLLRFPKKVEVFGYHPRDLNTGINYSEGPRKG